MQTELNKVIAALRDFYAHETFLFEKDIGERAITHRFAVHLEKQFSGWSVDCNYDRLGERTLHLPHGTIISTDDHLASRSTLTASGISARTRTIFSPLRTARRAITPRSITISTS